MNQIPEKLVRLPESVRDCYYGYYDNRAVDFGIGRCLCHRVAFRDRMPGPEDVAEIGWYPMDGSGEFDKLGESRAWNFQQGAMLQWVDPEDRFLLWNDAVPGEAAFAVHHRLADGEQRRLPRPVANLGRDGRYALSINFERLFDFRPGYGYVNRADPFGKEDAPEKDGVFLLEVDSGESRLILSLSAIQKLMRESGGDAGRKVLVNHITFNPSATRFIALARYFQRPGDTRLRTVVLLANRDGSDARVLLPPGMASHYWWLNDSELLFWCDGSEGAGFYRIDCNSGEMRLLDPSHFDQDVHMSVRPEGDWMIYDTYPDKENRRHLSLYHLPTGRHHHLGGLLTEIPSHEDLRCDLHPRWNPDGRGITIDSTHEGFRALYSLDLSDWLC